MDIVIPIEEPSGLDIRPEAGVPAPVLLQDEYHDAILIYRGTSTIVARFKGCDITKFGYPNDEALAGHPLYERGLRAYGVFEVKRSSWIEALSHQNRVQFSEADMFSTRHHLVITFHDSMFECVAEGVSFEQHWTPLCEVARQVVTRCFRDETQD